MSGLVLLGGKVWYGDGRVLGDGAVVVEGGVVTSVRPAAGLEAGSRPVRRAAWVGPALIDEHVHLAFGGSDAMLPGGVAAVRDLGAPLDLALAWQSADVRVAGPVLTAPGGYPSNGWGAGGFARPVGTPADAASAVRELAAVGVDVVKLALEPAGGQPVPSAEVAGAVVRAAHEAGLQVTAHALTAAMVARALDAGVDELAHTPVEALPAGVVDGIAAAGVRVVSTIETLAAYPGSAVVANAAALVAAGVPLRYGTDLGNAGTRPGADPRELDRLAVAGLGPEGALRAATRPIELGQPAALVGLDRDPLLDPTAWRAPVVVIAGERVIVRSSRSGPR